METPLSIYSEIRILLVFPAALNLRYNNCLIVSRLLNGKQEHSYSKHFKKLDFGDSLVSYYSMRVSI